MKLRKRFGAFMVLIGMLVALMPLMAVGQETDHCPDKDHPSKVESSVDGDLDDIVLPAGTVFCVKGATGTSGQITSDGSTPIGAYLPLNNGGQVPNVSYYIVYETPSTTTTTTVPEETTTTQPEETTTTSEPEETTTTTVEDTTTTTEEEATTTTEPEEEDEATPTTLPFTGPSDVLPLAALATMLVATGGFLLRRARLDS